LRIREYRARLVPVTISDQVRRAIRECGMTRYELAKRTGVSQSTLSRFVLGQASLTLEKLDLLAGLIGLELTVRGKRGKQR